MGLYTEAHQQEFVASMRKTAQDTLRQLMQVVNLAGFRADEESLRALDRFADGYRAQGVVNDNNTTGYTVGLGTLLGDLLLKKYGGKWIIDKAYSIETRNAAGATTYLFPYVPVSARLKGNTAVSIHRYFFVDVPRTLGFAAPVTGPLDKEAMLHRIKNNAATVVETFSAPGRGATFGLTAQSIAVLEKYLERTLNSSTTDANKERFMNLIGSFLGECIVARYGAKWIVAENGKARLELRVAKTVHFLDPFGKVAKRIENGAEDNLAFYFAEFIPQVIKASG
jgi:Domain of unknown function (DUF3806)